MKQTRWPAEWEQQEAIWFSWPHRSDTWPDELATLESQFAHIVQTAARFQAVHINAAEPLHPHILHCLKKAENVHLYSHPTDDVWCRDHGATFVIKEDNLHAIDWHFNAWGGKFPPWNSDDKVAKLMANACHASHYRSPLYLEGGAIEGNGAGVVITTEAVALNPNRNPGWDKNAVEQELKNSLGADTVFWLPEGIEGDDTDGHIDDLTRFVSEDAVVSIVEPNSANPNYNILQNNLERLQDLKTSDNRNIEIIELPMPSPIKPKDWRLETLPASYANFLLLNGAVLVPTFNQVKNDDRALGILRECFADREVIGIDCRDILFEGGALHCLSQQQPRILR